MRTSLQDHRAVWSELIQPLRSTIGRRLLGLFTVVSIIEIVVPTELRPSWLPPRVVDFIYSTWPWSIVASFGVLAGIAIARLISLAAGQHRRLIGLQLATRVASRGTWAKHRGLRGGPIQWAGFDDMIAYTRGIGGVNGGAFFRLEAIKLAGTAIAETSIVSASIRSLVTQERIAMHVDGGAGIGAPVIPKGKHFTLRAHLTPRPGITFEEFGRRFSCFHITVETSRNRYDLDITQQDTVDMRARLQQLEWEPMGEPPPFQPAT